MEMKEVVEKIRMRRSWFRKLSLNSEQSKSWMNLQHRVTLMNISQSKSSTNWISASSTFVLAIMEKPGRNLMKLLQTPSRMVDLVWRRSLATPPRLKCFQPTWSPCWRTSTWESKILKWPKPWSKVEDSWSTPTTSSSKWNRRLRHPKLEQPIKTWNTPKSSQRWWTTKVLPKTLHEGCESSFPRRTTYKQLYYIITVHLRTWEYSIEFLIFNGTWPRPHKQIISPCRMLFKQLIFTKWRLSDWACFRLESTMNFFEN